MKLAIARVVRSASLATVVAVTVPCLLSAQAPAPATGAMDVTLNVPLKLNDFDPIWTIVGVHCTIQPLGATGGDGLVSTAPTHVGLVDGSYSGTVQQHFQVTLQAAYRPGQQWTYQCFVDLQQASASETRPSIHGTPGHDPLLPLASGVNLVKGTFTAQ
jgi:hypothetical protein